MPQTLALAAQQVEFRKLEFHDFPHVLVGQ